MRHERFDKFTERARKVLSLAQEEAQRFNHNHIGTEHLLLGLLREGEGVAAQVLAHLALDLAQARAAVAARLQRGNQIVLGEIGLTAEAKRAIEQAVAEAQRLNHHYIGTEHLLLGLVAQPESGAGQILAQFGLDLERLRTSVREIAGARVVAREALSQLASPSAPAADQSPREQARRLRDIARELLRHAAALDAMAAASAPPAGEPSASAAAAPTELPAAEPVGIPKGVALAPEGLAVMRQATLEAQRFNHHYIGTEHLLLGLVTMPDNLAGQVLISLGAAPERVRTALEFIIGRGDRIVLGEIGVTPRTKKVLELAQDEARLLGRATVDAPMILLGVIREGEGIGVGVLESLHVRLEQARAEVLRRLSEPPPSAGAADAPPAE